jgi:preprotein translocase SecE subunit
MTSFWLFDFFKESYAELKKSTWLTRKEAAQSTFVVMLIVALVAAYVSSVDFVLSIFLGAVLGGR